MNENEIAREPRHKIDGYARVGWSSQRGSDILQVGRSTLRLRCLGAYDFAPDQVVALERLESTWLDGGVRVVHNRSDYPRKMSFYCYGGSDEVFKILAAAGFVPCGTGPAGRPAWVGAARGLLVLLVLYVVSSVIFRLWR